MSLLLASSRRCDSGGMTTDDFPPGSTDGQVWLWDASAGAWVLRVLTAADVGALADDYAPAWGDVTSKPSTYPPESHTHPWGDVTGKPSTYPPESHSHSWASLTGKPFRHQQYSTTVYGNSTATFNPFTSNKSTTLIIARLSRAGSSSVFTVMCVAQRNAPHQLTLDTIVNSSFHYMSTVGTQVIIHNDTNFTHYVTIQVISWDY
jgi:hypothetical protein